MIGKPKMKKLVDYGVSLEFNVFFQKVFAEANPFTG
jgi:hypothetical protein